MGESQSKITNKWVYKIMNILIFKNILAAQNEDIFWEEIKK
jgi:hypothetical protein